VAEHVGARYWSDFNATSDAVENDPRRQVYVKPNRTSIMTGGSCPPTRQSPMRCAVKRALSRYRAP
jgi:hypothetical protein